MTSATHPDSLAQTGNRHQLLSLLENTARPLIMGIINVTPDSFADGGRFFGHDQAVRQALDLAEAGADILDIGGESTRPYAEPVSLEEELRRVLPVIKAVRAAVSLPISIDTYKSKVARPALEAGASIINDISALRLDPDMVHLAAAGVPVVLMHMQGVPRDMQVNPRYADLLGEIKTFFRERLDFTLANGLSREQLILDPGIGFGKTFDHNLEILNNLHVFLDLGCPLLVGPSRKAFIGHLLGGVPAGEGRDVGSLAALAMAVLGGARIVRVHNVAYARQFLAVFQAIRTKPVLGSA
jgi:dihydropteroate synthase